ncbi:Uncharacterised protein [Mycobacteroides abscessus]|uniref:hypothetical protein n=1 Tax=Mycobacteroides abscessus TaxID=36809 RepID=UPI0005E24740|nr:hypothetical protein [Mycobacteroides abscessus]CPS10941.1 Uncharacterised protein [Mycobacteroides abscessus]CPS50601.1 Uncharacterised protein [Mycobacteroides abscessus]CPS93601.1 Uncharacterised protein [Mycobacteroides abscessus]CPS94360.1 Uncharacterised protein [Mycobacteroides abscessus]CPT61632.1 Uncharacterised protein [Mycobacteroides abscessus]
MSTAAHVRAVQDLLLDRKMGAADVAVYTGLVTSTLHLFGEEDARVEGFPDDAVLQAALKEMLPEKHGVMASWVMEHFEWISDSAEVLDALDEIAPDPFPLIPTSADSYRRAAEDLALAAGESCAAVSWAGAVATGRWSRLYSDREVTLTELEARDSVLAAARRGLSREEALRVARWVIDQWERVDDMATERAR